MSGLRKRRVVENRPEEATAGGSSGFGRNSPEPDNFEDDEDFSKDPCRMTLAEEVLLLGIADREGYTSFWNDSISKALRGCIMIELAARGQIQMLTNDPSARVPSARRWNICNRPVGMTPHHKSKMGDVLLDEAIAHIKGSTGPGGYPKSVGDWCELLTGETWNPVDLRYQLRQVRERISKSLVEKGVLTTEKQNFFFFDMTTHPVVDAKKKQDLIKRLQGIVLKRWPNENNIANLKTRDLGLVLMAYFADVLEDAFGTLTDSEYQVAMDRVTTLIGYDPDLGAKQNPANEILWAVVASFKSI